MLNTNSELKPPRTGLGKS